MKRYTVLTMICLLLLPAAASAQEKGKVGVTMGYPSSLGLLWHAGEKLALRPELGFGLGTSDSGPAESDSTLFSTGLSALFYVGRTDNLSTYVSPRYMFSRSSSDNTSSGGPYTVTTTTHMMSGSFGAQYFFGSRFSAYGEVGVYYERGTTGRDQDRDPDPIFGPFESKRTAFGTRSGVGVVLYF